MKSSLDNLIRAIEEFHNLYKRNGLAIKNCMSEERHRQIEAVSESIKVLQKNLEQDLVEPQQLRKNSLVNGKKGGAA